MAVAPPGSGKGTMIAYQAVKTAMAGKRVLIFMHKRELVIQQGRRIMKQFGYNKIGYYLSGAKHRELPIMIGTVQTMVNRKLNDFDLIIIDESHLQEFQTIFDYLPNNYIIGATATPERKGNQICLSKNYEAIVNEIKISELIELGYLAKANSFGVKIDLSGIKTKGGDFDNEMMGDAFSKSQLYDGVFENYQRLTPNKKALIFSPNIASSQKLVFELQKKGLPIKHIDGNSSDRKEIIQWFKETPNALLSNVGILTAGFDENTIEVVILYRATKSLPLFLQMCGRGSRINDNKNEFTILDFGNNITRHGFWEDDRDWQLIKKEKVKGVAPVKDCKCGALLRISIMVCPYCGYEFPPPETRTPIEIELERLNKNDVRLFKQYQKFIKIEQKAFEKGFKIGWVQYQLKTIQDLQDYGKFKGYKPNWANYKAQERGYFTS